MKEFYGERDILDHLDYIDDSYASMPKDCHALKPFRKDIRHALATTATNTFVLVATEKGKPTGIAVATKKNLPPMCLFVEILCTSRTCTGAGRMLMEHLMTVGLKLRTPYICLEAVKTSVPFYERLGFSHTHPAKPNTVSPNKKKKVAFMTVNVLWYFTCWLKVHLSSKDKAVIVKEMV
ncbi:MAG: GNAT family N-acetyltransferase [Pontimonas sp.]